MSSEEKRLADIVELVRDKSLHHRDALIEELLKDEESLKLLFDNNKEVAKLLIDEALNSTGDNAQRMRSFIMVNSREFLPLIAKKMKLAPVGPLGKPVFPSRQLYQPHAPSPKVSTPRASPKASTPRASPKASTPRASPKAETPRDSPKVSSPRALPKVSSSRALPKVETPRASPKDMASPKSSSRMSPKMASPVMPKVVKEKKRYRRGQPCPEGKERNPRTNRCRKAMKPCPEGKVRNPKTNRCKKA